MMTFASQASSLPEKASKGTCAVLTFDVKGGISAEECALLTDRFMVEFDKIGQFTLLPRSKMSEVLKMQEFSRSENCSATECAVEAGKLLSVQYMVYGSIGKFGSMYTLNTFMVNVESGATEKRATTDHEGRLEDLLKLAMRQNAQQLLGLSDETETKSTVAVVAQPRPVRGVVEPPSPKVVADEYGEPKEPDKSPQPLPRELTKGLILYYPFDKDEGRRITDWSGKRNNATVNGADFFKDGVRGGVYKFNGVNSVIEGSHENSLPTGGAPKTVSVWVKPLAVGGIILKHGNDAHILSQGFSFNINTKFTIWLAGYNIDVVSTGAMTPDAWNHLCVTYESSRASIYINGVLDTSGNFSQNIPVGTNLEIGHNVLAGNNNYFEGWLDDIMVYDRALSGEEVKQIYSLQVTNGVKAIQNKGPVDLKNGLILHYSFDRDESGRITDMSGNGNNATASGAKWTPNGKLGGAYEFDGVADVIDGAKDNTLPVGGAPKSMSVWVKPVAAGGLVLKHGSNAHDTAQGFSFLTHGDWTIWLAGYNTDLSSKRALTPDAWNHVCVTYESSRACIYINGALDATGAFSQNVPAGTNLEIGHNTLNGENNRYKGIIDEVRIYNRALTENEVKQIYAIQK
ncbi:MAG: LamG-like jellyroll fold domain-containing protein [bacterium]